MKSEKNLKFWGYFYLAIFLVVFVLTWVATGRAQVAVSEAPPLHPKFTDNNGAVLAGGFLYSYDAGTSNLRNTYTDSTGLVQNPDPIPLDASGAPSNGSTQTGIWLANQAYKFCGYNAALVQQWCVDNITGYLGLLNLPNTWTFQQTFTQPLIITATDNQIILGAFGNQTTLDFPPPVGNITLHFPNTADTIVGRATTDTLTNKTLTSPVENTPTVNSVLVKNGPGTYISIANQNPTGTTVNTLTKLVNAPSQAQIAASTDISGVVGICVSGCGNTANAVIQESGQASCVFDNTTVAGDFVTISGSVAGDCHDAGPLAPLGTQVIGQVLASGGAGTYPTNLLISSIRPTGVVCAQASVITVNPANTNPLAITNCALPNGSLNIPGKTFHVSYSIVTSPAGGYSQGTELGIGPTSALASNVTGAVTSSVSATGFWTYMEATCTVAVAGVFGSLQCTTAPALAPIGGTTVILNGGPNTVSMDLTGPIFVGPMCKFGTANAANACQSVQFSVEQLN